MVQHHGAALVTRIFHWSKICPLSPSGERDGERGFLMLRFPVVDHTKLIFTSMLPRVAFEYGHTWCAASTNAWACARSMPGRLTFRRAAMPYAAPPLIGPRSTSASTARSAGSASFILPATAFI